MDKLKPQLLEHMITKIELINYLHYKKQTSTTSHYDKIFLYNSIHVAISFVSTNFQKTR